MSGRGPRGRARTGREVGQTPVPSVAEAAETGRGRGIAPTTPEAEPAAPGRSPTGSGGSPTGSSNSNGNGDGSGGQSRESPPQAQASAGRAALRGKTGQTTGIIESDVIDPLARMSLRPTGGVGGEERQPRRQIESVPYTRPETCVDKKGTSGSPVTLMANYFEVVNAPNWVLNQYHVDFDPPIESRRLRLALVHIHDNLFPQNKAFDGSTLYSLTKLPEPVTEVVSERATDKSLVKIKIKWVCEIAPTSPNFVHLFNLVFRRCLSLYGMTQLGPHFYDMKKPVAVEKYNLDIVHGYATAIATHEMKLLLCAELSHRLIHTETVYDVMNACYAKNQNNFKDLCTESIIGQIVMTRYNDKTYKVDDIDWNSTPEMEFETRDGKISFIDYYKKHYNIDIRERGQPLLMSRPKQRDKRRGQETPILLVPELCVLTGLSDQMRSDNMVMRELATMTRADPAGRYERLTGFVNNLNNNPKVKSELAKWQMRFDSEPIKFQARTLDQEKLIWGNNKQKQLVKADWTNDMKSEQHILAVPMRHWVIFYSARDENLAYEFSQKLNQVAKSMGIRIGEPNPIAVQDERTENFVNAIKKNVNQETQMAVFVLSSNRKDRYDAIKKQCCLDLPVPSQVILTKNLKDQRKVMGVMTKVAVQMNCKLGGEIWSVSIPLQNVMICGIDTYHDSAKKGSSVCAFVATVNAAKTRFFSRATLQSTHQELSNNLTLSVKSALQHYAKVNNAYPEKIIVYRDGISDGQLPLVTDYEIPQITKAFELTQSGYSPRIAVIIVKKRGNARFFQIDQQRRLVNPDYGTVIDNTVTRSEWYDFYLVSQSTNQGTVNPTHYNVVCDTTGYKPDHFQRLSHKLTHMYYNWSGTIRVPALCQYAHKLAFLVGQSLHKEHNLSLCDKLFYL